jgi:thioredoxin 1
MNSNWEKAMKNVLTLTMVSAAGIFMASNLIAGLNHPTVNSPAIKKLETEKELVQAIKAGNTIIVDFYADWCGPCKTQSQILNHVAADLPDDTVRIFKVDVDELEELATKFRVRSIPALFVFSDGELVDKHTGVADEDQVVEWLGQ